MNLSDIFVAGAGASVTVLNDQTFNSSGTWTKPTGIQYAPTDMALIELWGGGGGGATASGGSGGWIGTGGAGGAYVRAVVPVSSLAATQAAAIGGGGAGAPNSPSSGGRGGDTSFAGLTASGGAGGRYYSSGQAVYDYGLNGYVGAPGTSLYTPGAGGWATSAAASTDYAGRPSIYGGNGGDSASSSSGAAPGGTAPGGGGGANRSVSGGTGGSGAPGRVRIRILRGLNQWEISEGPL